MLSLNFYMFIFLLTILAGNFIFLFFWVQIIIVKKKPEFPILAKNSDNISLQFVISNVYSFILLIFFLFSISAPTAFSSCFPHISVIAFSSFILSSSCSSYSFSTLASIQKNAELYNTDSTTNENIYMQRKIILSSDVLLIW